MVSRPAGAQVDDLPSMRKGNSQIGRGRGCGSDPTSSGEKRIRHPPGGTVLGLEIGPMNPVLADLNRSPRLEPAPRFDPLLTLPMNLRAAFEVHAIDTAPNGLEIGVPPTDLLVVQREIGHRMPADEHERAGIVQRGIGPG